MKGAHCRPAKCSQSRHFLLPALKRASQRTSQRRCFLFPDRCGLHYESNGTASLERQSGNLISHFLLASDQPQHFFPLRPAKKTHILKFIEFTKEVYFVNNITRGCIDWALICTTRMSGEQRRVHGSRTFLESNLVSGV